jgi:hypothetical protein
LLLRAATNPATITTQGWAAELAAVSVADALVGMATTSAAAGLVSLALQVEFAPGVAAISVPGVVVAAADAGNWVAEGAPIPVRAQNYGTGPVLGLHKLAVINVFTRELAIHSNVQNVVQQVVGEAAGLALDAAMFSTNTETTSTPGGILAGVVAGSSATGGTLQAFSKDVATLVKALADNGGGRNPVFIAAPGTAASMKAWAGGKFDYPILASNTLAAGTVVAIEASSLAIALSSIPEFGVQRIVSDEATLHMETAPTQQLVEGGSFQASANVRSLYQTDTIGLRTIIRINWSMRASGHVALLNSVSW